MKAIYSLFQFRKKGIVKNNKIKSVKKYIARSKAYIAAGLKKNSKAFFYAIRHDILASLKQSTVKSDKNNSQLENLIEDKFILRFENLKYSKEKRFEIANHFKNLFSKNFVFALKSFNDDFKPFINNEEFKYTEMAVELNSVTAKFIKAVKKIEDKFKDNWLANRRKLAVKKHKKESVSKNLVRSRITRKDFTYIVDLLSLQVFNAKMTHKISIRFPYKNFYNKLKNLNYIHAKKNCSISKISLINFADYEIIKYFNKLICGYLNWFRCADNIFDVKKI